MSAPTSVPARPEPSGPSGRPRVLLVNWRDMRNPEAGGAEVHLYEVATRLVRDGFTCIQYSHAFPGCKAEEDVGGVRVRRVGGKFLFNYAVWFRLRAWCRRDAIDVVLDDSNKIPFLLPWLTGLPVVAQIHHLFGRVLFHETAWPMALYVLAFESLMPAAYRRARVLTGSESSRRELLAKGFGKVAIAPEGADLALYRPPADAAKIGRKILYVGRIKRYKGLDVILQAAARLKSAYPDLEVQIAGSGDDVPRLKALAAGLGMDAWTRFLGFVSEAEKVELYGAARVVVNSSLKEGWGLTSIEANACGTPVVATDVPGLCDSVRDGETGFLVPFGDVDAFASALGRILADPAAAAAMREKALAWARAHTWEKAYEVTRDALLDAWRERA
ncbi:MAG TPA: glycosyltransferase family 4 protein [Fibrobacteria bacterium]|nr:glycosyltransferase family 4 protein [Fibrobacteria bacterium]